MDSSFESVPGDTSPVPEEAMLAQPQLFAWAFNSAAYLGAGAVRSQPLGGSYLYSGRSTSPTWCLAHRTMIQNDLARQDRQGLTGLSG